MKSQLSSSAVRDVVSFFASSKKKVSFQSGEQVFFITFGSTRMISVPAQRVGAHRRASRP